MNRRVVASLAAVVMFSVAVGFFIARQTATQPAPAASVSAPAPATATPAAATVAHPNGFYDAAGQYHLPEDVPDTWQNRGLLEQLSKTPGAAQAHSERLAGQWRVRLAEAICSDLTSGTSAPDTYRYMLRTQGDPVLYTQVFITLSSAFYCPQHNTVVTNAVLANPLGLVN